MAFSVYFLCYGIRKRLRETAFFFPRISGVFEMHWFQERSPIRSRGAINVTACFFTDI